MTARGEKVRSDDNPEVLKGRLAAYRAQTAPLAYYYASKGIHQVVDGMAPIDAVTAAIDRCSAIDGQGQAKHARKAARRKAKAAKAAAKPRSKAKPASRRAGPRARKPAPKTKVECANQVADGG